MLWRRWDNERSCSSESVWSFDICSRRRLHSSSKRCCHRALEDDHRWEETDPSSLSYSLSAVVCSNSVLSCCSRVRDSAVSWFFCASNCSYWRRIKAKVSLIATDQIDMKRERDSTVVLRSTSGWINKLFTPAIKRVCWSMALIAAFFAIATSCSPPVDSSISVNCCRTRAKPSSVVCSCITFIYSTKKERKSSRRSLGCERERERLTSRSMMELNDVRSCPWDDCWTSRWRSSSLLVSFNCRWSCWTNSRRLCSSSSYSSSSSSSGLDKHFQRRLHNSWC